MREEFVAQRLEGSDTSRIMLSAQQPKLVDALSLAVVTKFFFVCCQPAHSLLYHSALILSMSSH